MPPPTFPPNTTHKAYTLIFPVNREEKVVYLGIKNRGFGKGKHNGFGGKVEGGESVVDGAIRELEEEALIQVEPSSLKYGGVLLFHTLPAESSPTSKDHLQLVYVFSCTSWTGTPSPSEEMSTYSRPWPFEWKFYVEDMLRSARLWVPEYLRGLMEGEELKEGDGFLYYMCWRDGEEDVLGEVLEKPWKLRGLDGEEVVSEEELASLRRRATEEGSPRPVEGEMS